MQNLSCHLKTTQARSIVFAKWEALPHPKKKWEFSISEIMKILVGRGGGGGGGLVFLHSWYPYFLFYFL